MRPTTPCTLALFLWAFLAAGAPGGPIAQQGRAEIGGAATLTAERQAQLIAKIARGESRERLLTADAYDVERQLEPTDRIPAGPSEKLFAPGAEAFLASPETPIQPTLTQTPAPINAFTANRSDGTLAADTSIAVSYTHVVVTNRNQIGYYSKAGRQLGLLSDSALFSGLKLVKLFGQEAEYHDMHCLYDAYRNRFWVGAIAFKNVTESDGFVVRKLSKFVVAVSKTTNPLDGWNLYWWDAIPGDGHPGVNGNQDGDGSDYPSWGIDSFGVYESNSFCHIHREGNECGHEQLSFFPAAPLAAGVASLPFGWMFWDLKNPDGSPSTDTIQPAQHHGSSGGSTYFVSTENPYVIVWRLRNHLTPNQVLEHVAVPVTSFDVPTVGRSSQKGSSDTIQLDNLGNEALKAVYRSGSLYAVFNDAAPWRSASFNEASIRLVRMSVVQFPHIAVTVDRYFGRNSVFYDQPNDQISYIFPSLEVNKNGDMVVVYGRAGKTIYPEVFYSVYPAAGPDIQPERRLRQGDAPVEVKASGGEVQLHDFDGASVDPFDDTSVWMAAPYGEKLTYRPTNNWAIAVGKVLGTLAADLIVESVSHSVGTRFITVSASVRNQGDRGASASTVALTLRPLQGGASTKLGTIACKTLISDELVTLTKVFARPLGLPHGSYVLTAAADSTNAVLEYSGANNSANAGVVVVLK